MADATPEETAALDAELDALVFEVNVRVTPTDALHDVARACVDELRRRGAVLGIEGDSTHHHDALRSIESLATSARTVESRNTTPSNEGGQ